MRGCDDSRALLLPGVCRDVVVLEKHTSEDMIPRADDEKRCLKKPRSYDPALQSVTVTWTIAATAAGPASCLRSETAGGVVLLPAPRAGFPTPSQRVIEDGDRGGSEELAGEAVHRFAFFAQAQGARRGGAIGGGWLGQRGNVFFKYEEGVAPVHGQDRADFAGLEARDGCADHAGD